MFASFAPFAAKNKMENIATRPIVKKNIATRPIVKPPIPGNEYFATILNYNGRGSKYSKISKNNRSISLYTEECYATEIAYGLINIDTKTDRRVHKWQFRISKTAEYHDSIKIGICESFSMPSNSTTITPAEDEKRKIFYAFGNKGEKYAHNFDSGEYGGIEFNVDDYVVMEFDCRAKMDESGTLNTRLYLTVNGEKKAKPFLIKQGKMYKMRVLLDSTGSHYERATSQYGNPEIGHAALEMIDYSYSYKCCYDKDDEKKESVKVKSSTKKKKAAKKVKKNIAKELKDENARLQTEIDHKNSKIASLEKRILNFEKENKRLSKENKKLTKQKSASGNKSAKVKSKKKSQIIAQKKEEKEMKAEEAAPDGITAVMNNEFETFKATYHEKILKNILDGSPEKIMNQESTFMQRFNTYKQNVDGIILSSKSFSKYIQDIDELLLKMCSADVSKYEQWNVEQIISWIKTLENGRFNKHIDVLRAGFIESEITGRELPYVERKDLNDNPFNIKNFKDKKDLETYFKTLRLSDKEGGNSTVYIG